MLEYKGNIYHLVSIICCCFLFYNNYNQDQACSDAACNVCLWHHCSYAVADNSYRSLRTERKDQCILISGESGAGKTEASKKILQYYAVTCPASEQVQTVKDRLLQSNPVLEVSNTERKSRKSDSFFFFL